MEKIWIYTLSKQLTSEQELDLKTRSTHFVSTWTAHDVALNASFELYKNRLLIFKVDESNYAASGCSIDKQLRLVKELETAFSVELLNRMLVAYESNGEVEVVKQSQIKELLANHTIRENTLVFDNTITNSAELNSTWKKPLHETYLSKYLAFNQ
jgi:hypothetical protein